MKDAFNLRIKFPARSTHTLFKVQSAAAETLAFIKELGSELYGVHGDGSKRGDRDVFEIIVFGWSKERHQPIHKVVSVLDLGSSGKSENLATAFMWCIETKLELNRARWLVSVSDSTNSMSGLGKKGGCFKIIREWYGDATNPMPRLPCVLHVVHLGWAHVRSIMYGGTIPGPRSREIIHAWNYLWDLWKELGAHNSSFIDMKNGMHAHNNELLQKTWKPVASRWLYEILAAEYALVRVFFSLIAMCIFVVLFFVSGYKHSSRLVRTVAR